MTIVSYEARRRLVSYHVEGATYELAFDTSDVKPPSGGDLKVRTESLNGSVETLYFGRNRIWSFTTIPVVASSPLALLLYEFLESTADGQEFSLDPYGTGQALAVIRQDDGYTEGKFQEMDGPNDYVQLTFQVREV